MAEGGAGYSVDLDAGAGHRHIVQRQRYPLLDLEVAFVQAGARDRAVASDVDVARDDAARRVRAVIIDGAAIDGRAVERQRTGAVDGDGAAAGNDCAEVQQQRGTCHDLERVVGGDLLVVQRVAGARYREAAVVDQRAVLQEVVALKLQYAVDVDGAAGDGAAATASDRVG